MDTSRNPLTLAFKNRQLEHNFRDNYFNRILVLGRICHILSVFLFASFALWDRLVTKIGDPTGWLIATSIVTAVFACGLVLSFVRVDIYKRYWPAIYTSYVLVVSACFTLVAVYSGELFYKLFVGIIYGLIFNFSVIRLRFIWATFAGWLSIIIFIAGLAWYVPLDMTTLSTQAFVLTGICFLGMFVSYSMELSSRNDFLLNISLERARQKANNANLSLEKMVEERTRQLQDANQDLSQTIARELQASAQLKENEAALQRNLASLQLAEQIASLGYFEIDWGSKTAYWSSGFFKLFGWKPDEIEPSYDAFIARIHHQDTKIFQTLFAHSNQMYSPQKLDFRAHTISGAEIHILGIVSTAFDKNDQPLFSRGTLQDVTEAKTLQRQQRNLEAQLRQSQKMEAVGTLAGGIAHDFNNILGIIMGYAELADAEIPEGAPGKSHLPQIKAATLRAKKLVQQILTFSRKAEVDHRPLDLNQQVRSVVEIIKQTIPKMVDIELFLSDDIKTIIGDANQLEQVLINLATNAMDAMPDGGRLIIETSNAILDDTYCQQHLQCQSGEYVLLQVSDTGQGIAKDVLSHIFEPFFTTKEAGKGTGLGLSTIYGIVTSVGGYIYCYSEPGTGSTFKVYFPAIDGIASPDSREANHAIDIPEGNETIMLVDDEEDLLALSKLLLNQAGYQVILAGSGEEALELYKSLMDSIDLIIMDLSMPGMGGGKCLVELLKVDPRAKVIIASGYSPEGHLRDVLAKGAAGYAAKPYQARDMLNTIRKVLDE